MSRDEGAGMGITYDNVGGGDSFDDPFAADSMDDYDDVPMSRADYGIDMSSGSASLASSTPSGGARVTSGLRSSESGPNLDHLSSNDLAAALSLGSLPLHSMQGGAGGTSGRHFLPYERRSLLGQASYNIGYSYFGGLLLGGLLGFANGIRVSPNMRFRVLLNSVLNNCGKFGAKTGNGAGVLALVYTFTERQLEETEVDKLPGILNNAIGYDLFPRYRADALIPAVTAFATGVMFTLPRAMTMKGIDRNYITLPKRAAVCVSGGIATTLGVAALSVLGPLVFGDRSPFRFA